MNLLSIKKLSNKPLRVIAIDPGAGKAGYSVIELDFDSEKCKILHMETCQGISLAKSYFDKSFIEMNTLRTVMNMAHSKHLSLLLQKFSPNAVAVEGAYAKRISAFHSLVEHTTLLRAVTFNYDPFMEFCIISASQAKKRVGVLGNSGDKSDITNALVAMVKNSKLDSLGFDFTEQEEHANDAVAIGIGCCHNALDILKGNVSSSSKSKSKKKKRTKKK